MLGSWVTVRKYAFWNGNGVAWFPYPGHRTLNIWVSPPLGYTFSIFWGVQLGLVIGERRYFFFRILFLTFRCSFPMCDRLRV